MSTQSEPEALIELIASQTRSLLEEHFSDIESCRDGEEAIKIAFSHKLSYDGPERTVKTTISFSHRVKDEVEASIDTRQTELPIQVSIEKRQRK